MVGKYVAPSISQHVYARDKSFYTIGPIISLPVGAYIDRVWLKTPFIGDLIPTPVCTGIQGLAHKKYHG